MRAERETPQSLPPLLVEFMFGANAEAAWSTANEQLQEWSECFEVWLEEARARSGAKTSTIRKNFWKEFLQATRKAPWEVRAADIETWGEALVRDRLRVRTVQNRFGALASFYRFADRYFLDRTGRGTPNPAEKARRPRSGEGEGAGYLDEKESRAFLEATQRGGSLIGKRDQAYFLCILRSGLDYLELRRLRWEQLRESDGELIYMPREMRLPEACGAAIRAYLKEAGRWESMRREDYVFAPLKGKSGKPNGAAEDWEASRPVATRTWDYQIKQAALWAGLRREAINLFTLRNTAVYLRLQAGESEGEIAQAMHFATIQQARNSIRGILRWKKEPLWAEPDPERPVERRRKGKQPLIPSEARQAMEREPGGGERGGRPADTLTEAVGRAREMIAHLAGEAFELATDERMLFSVNRTVNRAAGRVQRLAPQYKKYQEYEAKEEAEWKRLKAFIERMERRMRGEEDEEEEEEFEYKGIGE